ncbi:AAA family ATPase [Arhodomonas aquaeolei]|uniref:Lon protease family protein n=1 Tax=Arhodomonas aquaeolei TaxID=2369 RepID=UPI0021679105|nr:AAA family ATPase [Arhodomonas aquaeolei]MCS4503183.1 AAA family ATPase [Arhodomonas aquaeolei]
MTITPLTADQVYQRCDPAALDFDTTDELRGAGTIIGQDRAIEALRLGTGVRNNGFNLFVLGPGGVGKHEVVSQFLHERASGEATPPDWCLVHDFNTGNRPRLIRLPPGDGRRLCKVIEDLVQELRTALPAAFESDEFQRRMRELQQEMGQRHQQAFREIQEAADQQGIALLQTQNGFTFAPKDENGEVMDPERFRELPEERREAIEKAVGELQERLQAVIQQMPRWRKEAQEKIRSLHEEMAVFAVGHLLEDLHGKWADYPGVIGHLDAIREDVTANVEALIGQGGEQGQSLQAFFRRYEVNLLVDNAEQQGARVVYEDMPSHQRLVGRVEHQVHQGALVTDHHLVRAGALHRANGGYLILDARKVLTQPLAWESLKRALFSRRVHTEPPEQYFSLISTVTLEPEPMPLDVKVILLGERSLYYLLTAYDPDFAELFKIEADFEEDLARTDESIHDYARLVATLAGEREVRPLDRQAVARVIEHASRMADDSERLSIHNRAIGDLLVEANQWAIRDDSRNIRADDIQQAIDHQVYRASRVRENIDRAIQRETLLIDTAGSAVGQVNGLSVMQLGGQAFGRPARITATARLGRGHMVDIEREAKLGGNIHSKGMMILSNLLASRFAGEAPLSLAASIAFEQSYGGIDGDSASVAEYCVLCSVLSGHGLAQGIAVTGSVNQHGQVQAVGGVNEKIEGFFDVCSQRGLDGRQGVALPRANIANLMLHPRVVDAVAAGRFHIWPLSHVDDALTLLTGTEAGVVDADGHFPDGTVNRAVADRLRHFAKLAERRSGGDGAAVKSDNGDNVGDGEDGREE